MPTKPPAAIALCPSSQLPELGKYKFNINFRGEAENAIAIRLNGLVHGYLNKCVHMPRALDCEDDHIFDESNRYIQCSMHKICYDPASGVSLSEICAGKKLTTLKLMEADGWIFIVDKRVKRVDSPTLG